MSSNTSNKATTAATAYEFCYECDHKFKIDDTIETFEHVFHSFCSEKCYDSYMTTICPSCEEQICSCSDYGPEVEEQREIQSASDRMLYTYYDIEDMDGDDVSDCSYD